MIKEKLKMKEIKEDDFDTPDVYSGKKVKVKVE